jgi:uncharacterized membrane protein
MRLRGHTGIRVGIVLAAVGLLITIVGIVLLVTQSFSKVDGFQRVSFAQSSGSVTFGKAGDYVAYYEAPGVTSDIGYVPGVAIELRSAATGADVELVRYGNNANGELDRLTYSYGGHHGVAYRQFHISAPGRYQVTVRPGTGADPSGDVAFGTSIARGTVLGAAATVVGVLLLIAGVIVLIVGVARRHGHKKQLQRYGYPPMYPPSIHPPPGFAGRPGYPPPGYPPSAYPPPPAYPAPGSAPPGSAPPGSAPPEAAPPEPWPPNG